VCVELPKSLVAYTEGCTGARILTGAAGKCLAQRPYLSNRAAPRVMSISNHSSI
jgi:hypothetical protein